MSNTRILKPKEAAEYLGIPADTLAGWWYLEGGDHVPRGPRPIVVNGRRYGYTIEALDAWRLEQGVAA